MASIFILNVPMAHSYIINNTHYTIKPTIIPLSLSITKIVFAYIIMTKKYISTNIACFITVNENRVYYSISNTTMFNPV
jgi:hypothetical protein